MEGKTEEQIKKELLMTWMITPTKEVFMYAGFAVFDFIRVPVKKREELYNALGMLYDSYVKEAN